MIAPPEIFNRKRRTALRNRAGRRSGDTFLWRYIALDLAERLALVSRSFGDILIIGPVGAFASTIMGRRNGKVVLAPLSETERSEAGIEAIEEDRLPFAPASFGLIISAGTLDSVNDLPGALIQMRRALRPDGLFLGQMFGAGSWKMLKGLMLTADGERALPHIHPQIDVRSAADLLARAGFALPVVDQESMAISYRDWRAMVSDLRDAGIGNALAGPRPFLGKNMLARLDTAWSAMADEQGRVEEQVVHLNLIGWAPSENQPRPAKRGSGQVSLTELFPPKSRR